jgi:hypothetical protein
VFLFIILAVCCKKEEDSIEKTFDIDLTNPSYVGLTNLYASVSVYTESGIILIANRGGTQPFIAASASCPNCGFGIYFYHDNTYPALWHCSNSSCNNVYSVAGELIWGTSTSGLKVYKLTRLGDILTIHLGK